MDRTSPFTHSTLDSNNPVSQVTLSATPCRDLLTEAETGLSWLRRRAELIRLEIQAIELELALQQARAGENDSLVAWLHKNGTPWQEQPSNRFEPDTPHTSPFHQPDVEEIISPKDVSSSLFATTCSVAVTSPDCDNASPNATKIQDKPVAKTTSTTSVNVDSKPKSQKRPYLKTPANQAISKSAKPKPVSPAQPFSVTSQKSDATQLQLAKPEKRPSTLKSPKKQGRLSKAKKTPSWMVSTAVHAALLLLLMLFTIPLPKPKEKLGLTGTFAPMNTAPLQLENTTAQADQELISPDLTEPTPESTLLENVLEKSLPTASDIAGNSFATPGIVESLATPPGTGSGTADNMLDGTFMDTLSSTQSLASANFFGLEATGNIFCFVVDCSGSMRGEPFTATKLELLKTISQLKPNQRFSVFFFSQKLFPMMLEEPIAQTAIPVDEEFRPTAVYATPENLTRLQLWMETVPIGAGGPPNQALKLAIELEPDSIFLLTDGVTRSDVAGNLIKTNRQEDELDGPQIRCPIHTIGFYSKEGEALLQRIATENGGQYRYVPNPQPPKKSKKMAGGT